MGKQGMDCVEQGSATLKFAFVVTVVLHFSLYV